jgi:hypothetical protein
MERPAAMKCAASWQIVGQDENAGGIERANYTDRGALVVVVGSAHY